MHDEHAPPSSAASLELMTDGGGSREKEGAAACILLARPAKLRLKFAAFLGPCTGNEAEIMAAILGLIVTRGYRQVAAEPSPVIEWTTDSKYLIHMCDRLTCGSPRLDAGTPNRNLWLLWAKLAVDLDIRGRWVRGHDGHRENEACDRACRWLQRRGRVLLADSGEGPIGQAAKQARGESWVLLDGERLFRMTVAANLDDAAVDALQTSVAAFVGGVVALLRASKSD